MHKCLAISCSSYQTNKNTADLIILMLNFLLFLANICSVERYNAETNTWTKIADMNARRSGAGVGVVDDVLYAIGGHDGPLVRKSCEKYSVETDSWSPVAGEHCIIFCSNFN